MNSILVEKKDANQVGFSECDHPCSPFPERLRKEDKAAESRRRPPGGKRNVCGYRGLFFSLKNLSMSPKTVCPGSQTFLHISICRSVSVL